MQRALVQLNLYFFLHINENKQPVHMRYHLCLHYEWFLHNLGKEANMQLQVIMQLKNYYSPYKCANLCNKSQSLRNIFVFSILLLQIFFAKMTQTATTRAYATMVHVHVSRDGTKNLIAQVCICGSQYKQFNFINTNGKLSRQD